MSTDMLKATFLAIVEEVWNQRDPFAFNRLFDTDFIYHNPHAPDIHTAEAYERHIGIQSDGKIDPVVHFTVEEIVAEGDKVAARYTFRTPPEPQYPRGMRTTKMKIEVTGMCICRIVAGKVVEMWVNWDRLTLMHQMRIISETDRSQRWRATLDALGG